MNALVRNKILYYGGHSCSDFEKNAQFKKKNYNKSLATNLSNLLQFLDNTLFSFFAEKVKSYG